MNTSTETKLHLGYTGLQIGYCIGFSILIAAYVMAKHIMNLKKKNILLF